MNLHSVITHTISPTEIPAPRQFSYKQTFCQNVVSTKKLLVFVFSQKHSVLKCWSTDDQSSFFCLP